MRNRLCWGRISGEGVSKMTRPIPTPTKTRCAFSSNSPARTLPTYQILSSIDAAPKLYYSDSPNSDAYYWQMVVMEYLPTPPTMTLYDFEGTPAEARQVGEDLKRAVGTLHDQGYVFGDLRSSNILVEPEPDGEGRRIRVALVDFDWAGKEGEVRYPVGISVNGGINWPEGVVPRGLITKEHDEYWLRTWLDCLS
ncbi:hypothetical protein Moror_11907 [Moniliophthora roreri MCA 2997]|uniref:Protein kinase domain-containing protein n=1 Tax=Moniliophthora roreri (strain MCA 2997) TaxID=1381753 RepID=V2X3R2_MONRO|nr:hypothetical protein Moror_11907 [Moniliophthora roreri MCA 2997]